MAATVEARRLTEAHRVAQASLGARVAAQAVIAWQLIDMADIDGTASRWLSAMLPLVGGARRRSARLAANYVSAFRTLELGLDADSFTPVLDDAVDDAQLVTSLMVTGPISARRALTRTIDPRGASRQAAAASASAAMRHTMNGGRGTVLRSVDDDRTALGWGRAVGATPCAFCAMLASRGPVYKDDSFARSNTRFVGDGEAKVHDGCGCSVEPVYRRDAAWPARAEQYREIWEASTAGKSGKTAINAFRSALAAA